MNNILINSYKKKLNLLDNLYSIDKRKFNKFRQLRAELQKDINNINELQNKGELDKTLKKTYLNLLETKYKNILDLPESNIYKTKLKKIKTLLQRKFKGGNIDLNNIDNLELLENINKLYNVLIMLEKNKKINTKKIKKSLETIENLKGAGLFDSIKNFVSSRIQKIQNYFNPYLGYRPKVSEIIKENENNKIIRIYAFRKPIMSILNKVLNLISNNKFDEGKKLSNYDNMYHLGLIVILENNKNIRVEKNERIDMEYLNENEIQEQGELLSIDINKNITFGELLKNAQDGMKNEYFEYTPFGNNCQVYSKSLLLYSGLLSDEANNFIFQPIETIIKTLPKSTPKIAKLITKFGAFLANLGSKITGKGAHTIGGVVSKVLSQKIKEQVPKKIKEAYDFIASIPKKPTGEPPIIAKTKEELKQLRKQWEEKNKPEMEKILNMSKSERDKYKQQKTKEYNDYINKPEQQQKIKEKQIKEGKEGLKMVEKAKKYSALKKLISDLESKEKTIKEKSTKILNPEYRKQLIKNYNDDIEAVKNYDFYKVKNIELKDQLDKQYLKMYNNMKNRPKIYGFLPENKNFEYGQTMDDPRYIKYIYENYGKPEPDFLGDIVPNVINDIIGLIPVIGDIAQPLNEMIIESGKEKPKETEEIPDIDYTKGYEEVLNIDDLIKKAEEIQTNKNKNLIAMNTEKDQLKQQQQNLLSGSGKINYYDLLKKMEKKLIK
jgi:hypothetical protein